MGLSTRFLGTAGAHGHVLFLLLGVLGLACLPDPGARQVRRVELGLVVVDVSSSTSAVRCPEVVARAHELLTGALHVQFLALATGNTTSAGEPSLLVDAAYDQATAAFEDPDAEATRRARWLKIIGEECGRRYPGSRSSSPIFAALVRALHTLHARRIDLEASGATVNARLWVHSDLRENVEPAITAHLAQRKTSKKKLPPLPTLDTGAAVVRACGVSDHRAAKGEPTDPRLVYEVWKQVIPELAPPEAVCPSMEVK